MATSGSSQSQPVKLTSAMPTTTPTEVHTSVTRCLASASSAIERCSFAARNITQASRPLSAELTTESARPQPTCWIGWGSKNRCPATQMMPRAAAMIRMPSKPDEKYSALWWP